MIHSIQIHGYRGFNHFEMAGLGRVNLIVGTNNSGKSSVLEALYLLVSAGDPACLFQLLWRRGERSLEERNPRHNEFELDVSHLFHAHEFRIGSKFSLSAKNQTPSKSLGFEVAEATKDEQAGLFRDVPATARLVLRVTGNPKPPIPIIPIGPRGGISSDLIDAPNRLRRGKVDIAPAQYVTTESLTGNELVTLWDKVTLTPDEALVLNALKFLDPDLERIAAQASQRMYYGYGPGTRGGFIIKRKGHDHPIPIGSMGDGMWRMLAMAIAVTQCKGGVLLVDEIDTGLHYSVMTDMWRLIFGAAKQFNVQVFATSHSEDCVHSLARICAEADAENPVTLQRIEFGKSKSVPYTESEIAAAAARGIEVR